MKDIAWYNGKIAPIDEMMIPMNERSSFLGDGVYDVAAVLERVPLSLDEHIDRLYRSASLIRIQVPMEKQEMREVLIDLVNRIDDPAQFLYMQVTRGVGPRNHLFRYAGEKPSIWLFTRPHVFSDVYAEYSCITMEDTRFLHCNIKTIDLLPSVMAAQAAEEAGCQETIFHRGDRVTECAHSNVHILKNGALITAPTDNLILPGIARAHVLNICSRLGIPVEERPYTLQELWDADEVFFTASSALGCRVTTLDGKPVGGKDLRTFGAIRDEYQREVRAEIAAFQGTSVAK